MTMDKPNVIYAPLFSNQSKMKTQNHFIPMNVTLCLA